MAILNRQMSNNKYNERVFIQARLKIRFKRKNIYIYIYFNELEPFFCEIKFRTCHLGGKKVI